MPKLSAIIIAKNEERDLGDCLKSLSCADSVVVIDGDSSDGTVDIALRHGARVQRFADWPGFGAQKQRALDLADGHWILSIDSDERLSDSLSSEISEVLSKDGGSYNGYEIKRHNYYLGRRLRFGGWGNDFVLRLARRSSCRFDLAPVHERLLVDGPIGRLAEPMTHLSYSSKREILDKRHRYAEVGANKLFSDGKSCSGIAEAAVRAGWSFFKHGVLQVGLLDGPIGIYAAYCKAAETYLKYSQLAKMSKP